MFISGALLLQVAGRARMPIPTMLDRINLVVPRCALALLLALPCLGSAQESPLQVK
jgi:hypothetical protein